MKTSAQQREEREKGKLVKRDSVPKSPRWKSHSRPVSSGNELDWQEEAASPGQGQGYGSINLGTGFWGRVGC